MPVLCALRERFPKAFIAWAVQERAAPLLEGHPCVDRLILVPRNPRTMARDLPGFLRQLRAHRFDIAIDPQSLSKSALVAWCSGAGRRIGFGRPQGRELSLLLNNERLRPSASHMVDRYLELLRPLGIDSPTVRFLVPSQAASTVSVQSFLRASRLESFAVLNPGAGWDSRLWPAERYGKVARHLGQRHGLRCVVTWAGQRELGWAQTIVAAADGDALLAPPTSLPELAALLREAVLFVGSDTGPLHLAAAVGTRCVGLYGPTRAESSGAYGDGHAAVQSFHQTGSNPRRRRAGNHAMQAICAVGVCRACDEVLGARRG
jgi:ADP-heptose:LPS heptosyltransferase